MTTPTDDYKKEMKNLYERMIARLEQIATNVHLTPDTLPDNVHVRLETPNEELRRHGHLDVPPTSPEDTQEITPLFEEDDTHEA